MRVIAVFALALALCAVSFAQRGGGMRMGGPGGGDANALLARKDVQKELAISDDVVSKIEAIRDKLREDMQELRSSAGGNGPPNFEAMRPQIEKLTGEARKQIEALLTADQIKRLKELGMQRAGMMAAMRPETQKDLSLTDEQKASLKALQQKQREAMQAIRERMQNGEIDRDQMRPLFEKNRDIMLAEIGKILTDEQKAKLKDMAGKPFTFDKDEENN
ncbi:MAG: hypothetical protein HY248_06820 [Fimbriimonas ginsengisoli]|uniref:Periplasmic heavy metal sensor n=1 Tax=Fimbriimonas ginsengisoli TaxID=1005039 RepID=A0A931PUL8_FIMGI|nr:hypothetical protein [Fimbriimonas ginsengisoli]MBI3722250.1 hypothetical protein [Fimbriimonas ginsengisoli]